MDNVKDDPKPTKATLPDPKALAENKALVRKMIKGMWMIRAAQLERRLTIDHHI